MKQKITIKAVYSWYNVYVGNVMILTHQKVDDIMLYIAALHETNTPYDLFV